MKHEIESATNGYILRSIYAPGQHVLAYEKESYTETVVFERLEDVLRHLIEEHDPGSRHDKSRLYVIRAPGDKHDAFTKEHAKVIWGEDKDE